MVFVLGKSGSGKSTLLNLIGGLDFADSGEIVIDGKSSKDFKPSDYDAYRNTYIGFVFQEYNVINEFTVGENVSLALELQSQKDNKQRVEDILKEVELEGYADRKPNELSGGQKQRVAIARAIVKNPKIIMADEPTGALDSETGKAIFDTLKRLSQDRLVIVVSHDREFAETYGDRIIELADGQVISDEVKNTQSQDNTTSATNDLSNTANAQQLKKSRLPYRRALAMGAKTLRRKKVRIVITIILCFLSFAAFGFADTMVAFDAKKAMSSSFYKGGENYVSFNTYIGDGMDEYSRGKVQDIQGISCSSNDLQRIKQLTGLDFQGVLHTTQLHILFYDDNLLEDESGIEYYKDHGKSSTILPASQELFDAMGFRLYGSLPNNKDEIVITKHCFEQIEIAGIIGLDETIKPGKVGDIEGFLNRKFRIGERSELYTIVGVVDTFADTDGALKNCNPKDEYTLNWMLRKYFGYGYHSLIYTHQSVYDNYINKYYREDTSGFGRSVEVYGIVAGIRGVAKQDSLKYVDSIVWLDGKGDRKELAENEILIGIDRAKSLWPPDDDYRVEEKMGSAGADETYFNNLITCEYMSLLELRGGGAKLMAYCQEAERLPVEKLEIYKQYCKDVGRVFSDLSYNTDKAIVFVDPNERLPYDVNPEELSESKWRYSYACYLSHRAIGEEALGGYESNITGEPCGKDVAKEENTTLIFINNRIKNAIEAMEQIDPQHYSIRYSGSGSADVTPTFLTAPKIVGIYLPKEGFPTDYVINDKIYDNSLNYEETLFSYMIAPLNGELKTKDAVNMITDLHYDTSEVRNFYCNSYIFFEVDNVSGSFSAFSVIAYVVSGVLGLFTILLLGNYIEQSISSKKKEIGILRAVGAKKSDIFAIFINEGVIITAIILVLACIGADLLTLGLNALLLSWNGLTPSLSLLNFGIRQIAELIAVGFGTTAIASAIPLYKLSKKKPADSIQDR
ncbi:MAG: ABC transporter ATP-binding protein/permease [Muribaculaceae bacterium]|nr:ABC transporter ATP-binding protein/permease [Muribaculaceae bacterium]